KRRTAWNTVVGGLAGSFAVLAGSASVYPRPQAGPVILVTVPFLWTPPHFWSLAAAKADDYASAGFPMLPVVASQRAWPRAILSSSAGLVMPSLVPAWLGLGWIYGVFAATGGFSFLWKSWLLHRDPGPGTAIAN